MNGKFKFGINVEMTEYFELVQIIDVRKMSLLIEDLKKIKLTFINKCVYVFMRVIFYPRFSRTDQPI